jgi:hypothetical protein
MNQSVRKVSALLPLLALFAATAAVILWQHSHVAVLWDMAYVLDSAARIARGQMPYRDFPFVHAPLTFMIQAALLRLAGPSIRLVQIYTALAGGAGTVLTALLLHGVLKGRVAQPRLLSLLLATPLAVLGIYCIFPFPSYDCDCILSVLLALCLLQRVLDPENSSRILVFLAGASLCLPLFFKQNIGLPFLAAALFALVALLALRLLVRTELPPAPVLRDLLLAAIGTLSAALLVIQATCGLGNYLHWTVRFAMQRRMVGVAAMLTIFREPALPWMLLAIAAGLLVLRFGPQRLGKQCVAFVLLVAPLLYPIAALFLFDDADERGDYLIALWPLLLALAILTTLWNLTRGRFVRALLPLLTLTAIYGTLLSQQLWGSTYALWPLGMLLVAGLLGELSDCPGASPRLPLALGATLAAVLLVAGSFYTASEERLSYIDLDGSPTRATLPVLRGLATPGPYLPEFEELLRYAAAKIPQQDGILLLPGEDPFYYATGRAPQFPVLLFDPSTDPLTPPQVAAEARSIRWLIVKTHQQIKADPTPARAELLAALLPDYTLVDRLTAYDIYRRNQPQR